MGSGNLIKSMVLLTARESNNLIVSLTFSRINSITYPYSPAGFNCAYIGPLSLTSTNSY